MAKVVITGGSGILGRALLARWAAEDELTVLSRSEKLQLPLRAQYPQVRFLLGDIRDRCTLARAFAGQDVVVHAAALKHVPLSEAQPTEYTSINVVGSLNVVEMAALAGARVVAISTDKACAPRNVYGHTKLLMERICTEQGAVAIRYGNVFASDGSVIPRWRSEVAATGQITVTDPTMTRFFFRIEDAVHEIEWALETAPEGAVVIPALKAITLGALAEAFLAHVGTGTVAIAGPRPGEKQHEALLSAEEGAYARPIQGRILLRSVPASTPLPAVTSDTAPALSREEVLSWLG